MIFDTDNRFSDYCMSNKIKDPFRESHTAFSKRCHHENNVTYIREETEEEKAWRNEWKKRRDEFLRLEHTFRLWDFHFWMDWKTFAWHCKMIKEYADTSIYMPCDCAERQCNMACAYFGGDCPRRTEDIKVPEILGFEGRWEFTDDYDC